MPTETFFKLPQDKRDRIFEAAVEEFSHYRFSEASINRIVKAAQIPRGSFYQYFQGKEDIYQYILGYVSSEKFKVFSKFWSSNQNSDFFEIMLEALPTIFDWADNYLAFYPIGTLMAADGSNFIKDILRLLDDSQANLLKMFQLEQQKKHFREDISPEVLMSIYLNMSHDLLQEYYLTGTRESTIEKFRAMCDILANGVVHREV